MNNFNIPKNSQKKRNSIFQNWPLPPPNQQHTLTPRWKKIKNPLHHYYTEKKSQKFFLPSPRIPSEKNQISLAVTPQKHFWKKK